MTAFRGFQGSGISWVVEGLCLYTLHVLHSFCQINWFVKAVVDYCAINFTFVGAWNLSIHMKIFHIFYTVNILG